MFFFLKLTNIQEVGGRRYTAEFYRKVRLDCNRNGLSQRELSRKYGPAAQHNFCDWPASMFAARNRKEPILRLEILAMPLFPGGIIFQESASITSLNRALL